MADNEEEIIIISDDESTTNNENNKDDLVKKDSMECPICLQTCIHPAKLPCGHIFCFLCVKGVAYKNRRCAMCRREIPPEFLDHPQLVLGIQELCKTKTTEDGYQWFYEGRNGWWQYDERTSQDIEDAYKKGEKSCTILVAGYVYIVDFEAMIQQRQNDPSRRRHVKRDLASIPKKGVAGLRIDGTSTTPNSTITTLSSSNNIQSSSSYSLNSELLHYQEQRQQQPQQNQHQNVDTNYYNHQYFRNHNPLVHNNIISTIAVTDTASRIASDIIGSTLAHADETILRSPDNLELNNSLLMSNVDLNGATNNLNNINSNISGINRISYNRFEFLEEAEELLNATVGANLIPIVSRSASEDLFSHTLENFRSLTLRNVMDSSDSDDDNDHEQIIL